MKPLKDGNKNGYFEETSEDGSITKAHYINGKPDGLAEIFYPNGQLKSRCFFKNGKVNGPMEEYYKENTS